MDKKNGFTLIELLAVIVVLAFISLIAIPMIMNVIESSKKGAYEESLRNLIKAAEYYEISEKILGNKVDFTNGISVLDDHIEIKNKNFKTGVIKKSEDGEFYLENVSDGDNCAFGIIDHFVITKGACEGVEPPAIDTTLTLASIMTDERVGKNGSINEDNFGNKRYAGNNPNNYVCFGIEGDICDENHLYRIIGIIDGKAKIIKSDAYNIGIPFDRTGTYGSNNWGLPAALNTALNGTAFYENTSYIDAISKTYIINATWYIGGTSYKAGANTLSSFESTERNSSTTGYIGLMSVTDFGYASDDIFCDKDATDLYKQGNACMSNNWLYDRNNNQWTLTPNSDNASRIWDIQEFGYVCNHGALNKYVVRPSFFLDPILKIKLGEGTSTKPYILDQ